MAREIAAGITIDPTVMVGKPVIKGTRVPVELVLAKLGANPDVQELLTDYPHLTVGQIQDCLRYAAALVPRPGDLSSDHLLAERSEQRVG